MTTSSLKPSNHPGARLFVLWFREAVALCDEKMCMFFNRHAIHSKDVIFVEYYRPGMKLPEGWEDLTQ